MAVVTPDQARDFYRAAASCFRQAAWRSVGGDEPIRVECEQVEGGPRFAIVLGKKTKIKGLWLCDDSKTCFLAEWGQYQAIAEHLRYTRPSTSGVVGRSARTIWRGHSGSASRSPVPEPTRSFSARSEGVISAAPAPGNWNCRKPASR